MGCYEGRVWVSLHGVGHVEMSEGFFGLTPIIEEIMISREIFNITTNI